MGDEPAARPDAEPSLSPSFAFTPAAGLALAAWFAAVVVPPGGQVAMGLAILCALVPGSLRVFAKRLRRQRPPPASPRSKSASATRRPR